MEQSPSSSANKVWESVSAYTVQCASCSKWRLIPSKEKYEEIRETINEQPFTCDIARQWKPDISCEKESDVKQEDQNWVWAMDKPNIPRTPKGWQRIIRTRAEGGAKFADVYYVSPSNKRLRSMVELNRYPPIFKHRINNRCTTIYVMKSKNAPRYLGEHPQFVQEGVAISQFSFQPPVSFDDNHVPRRRARSSRAINGSESTANPVLSIVPYANKD